MQQHPQRRTCRAGGKAVLCKAQHKAQTKRHQCTVHNGPAACKSHCHRRQPAGCRAQLCPPCQCRRTPVLPPCCYQTHPLCHKNPPLSGGDFCSVPRTVCIYCNAGQRQFLARCIEPSQTRPKTQKSPAAVILPQGFGGIFNGSAEIADLAKKGCPFFDHFSAARFNNCHNVAQYPGAGSESYYCTGSSRPPW